GDLAGGRAAVEAVSKDAPRDISALYLLAQTAVRAGDAAGAESAATRIREIDANDPRGPLAFVGARSLAKDYAGSIAAIQPLVDPAGDAEVTAGLYARYVTALAGVYSASGDAAKSIQALEAGRTRAPDDATIALGLASAYDKANDADKAETVYRDIIKRDP